MSYKNKIRIFLVTACGLAIILTTFFLGYFGINEIKDMQLKDAGLTAQLIGSLNDAALVFDNSEFSAGSLKLLQSHKQVLAACIYNIDGRLFANYKREGSSIDCAVSYSISGDKFQEVSESQSQYHLVTKNIYGSVKGNSNEVLGKVVLYSSLDGVYGYLYRQISMGFAVIIIMLILSYFLSRKFEAFIYNPVQEIINTAQSITSQNDYSYRAKNPFKDELSQIIECFNSILNERERAHQTFQIKCKDYANAYQKTNQLIKVIQREFDVSYKSLIVLVELFQKRCLGAEIESYTSYLQDLGEDMECYKNFIQSTLELADVYEKSLLQERNNISLLKIIEERIVQLPDLKTSFQNECGYSLSRIGACVYEGAFERSISLSFDFINVLLRSSDLPLRFELRLVNEPSMQIIFKASVVMPAEEKLDRSKDVKLDDLINDIKSGNWDFGGIEHELNCHPTNALVLTSAMISPEEYKYIVDSIRYISNANDIIVTEKLSYNTLELALDISSCFKLHYPPKLEGLVS